MERAEIRMIEDKLREAICQIGRRMYEREMVAANDGNISVRLPDNRILCTPTGVSKGYMKPEMLCVIAPDGTILEAENGYKPSSEMKMHLRVYEKRPDINAVVHAHPVYATCFAVARTPLEAPITAESVMFLGEVPVTKFAAPSTCEVPDSINEYVMDYNAMLLANHGALTFDESLEKAYHKLEAVEFYARLLYLSGYCKRPEELTKEKISKIKALV